MSLIPIVIVELSFYALLIIKIGVLKGTLVSSICLIYKLPIIKLLPLVMRVDV